MAYYDGSSEGEPPPSPNEGPTRDTGEYLTRRIKEFLKERLDRMTGKNWVHLAIEMNFSDAEIENLGTKYASPLSSPTLDLLQCYEQDMGGIDVDHLMRCLSKCGRNDIITDLEDFKDEQGVAYPLTERYNGSVRHTSRMPVSSHRVPQPSDDCTQSVPSTCDSTCCHHLSQIAQNVQNVVINGPVIIQGHAPCEAGSGDSCSTSCANPIALKEVQKRPQSADSQINNRPKSDPVPRKAPEKDDRPSNLRESYSSPSMDSDRKEQEEICVLRRENPEVDNQREVDQLQQNGDYNSLRSHESVKGITHGATPSAAPKDKCFVISTLATEDMETFRKIVRSLSKASIEVSSIHDDLAFKNLLCNFRQAHFVVVVYTKVYETEIKTEGLLNWKFFQEIKEEFKKNGNMNKRFVPVFGQEIMYMPNPLLRCDLLIERKAKLLLTPCNSGNVAQPSPADQNVPQNNLSPQFEGSTMNNYSAGGGQRSQSVPHIVCESHTHAQAGTRIQPVRKENKFAKILKKIF